MGTGEPAAPVGLLVDGVSNPQAATESILKRRIPLVLGPFVEGDDIPSYRKDRPSDWPKPLLAFSRM